MKIKKYGYFVVPRKIEKNAEYNEITDIPLKRHHILFKNLEFATSHKYSEFGRDLIKDLPEFKNWDNHTPLIN